MTISVSANIAKVILSDNMNDVVYVMNSELYPGNLYVEDTDCVKILGFLPSNEYEGGYYLQTNVGTSIPTKEKSNKSSKKYYIIRHKETHQWLPCAKNRNKTSAELTDKEPPRLFSSLSSAKNALNWWSEGVWYAIGWREYGNYEVDIDFNKKNNRNKSEMEIVPLTLQFI